MQKIVIIGASDFQNPLIEKAKNLGYETHVFAWQDGSIGEQTAYHFYPISIVEKEQILKICRDIQPNAVATIASDLGGAVVNYLAQELGLPCNGAECSVISTNKYEMRRALRAAGIPTPGFVCVDTDSTPDSIQELRYPLIVKPTDRSGSRAINRIAKVEEWMPAVRQACEQSFEGKAITEEYLEGQEYSCECISYQGKHTFLALTQKYTTGAPHYIETAHIQPAGVSPEQEQAVQKAVFAALDALQIRNGASHTELKIDANGHIGIIEIGARMGGDCIGSHLVPLSTGYDFVKMVIDVAAGKEPDLVPGAHYGAAAIRFIYHQEDLDQLRYLQEQHAEQLQYVSEIHMGEEGQITDSSSRFGYYIVACGTREEAKELLKL